MRFDQIRALDAELKSLASDERAGLVHFLSRLDLLDRERAYAELACHSPFEYLVKELHFAEGTAWRRVNAMQLLRTFPQLEAALADGRLNLTTLGILGKLMTPGNVEEVVRRGAYLTKRQAEELAVSLQPRKTPADGLRRLPERAPERQARALPAPEVTQAISLPPAAMGVAAVPAPVLSLAPEPQEAGPRPRDRARLEPVAAKRWQWRVTLDEERKKKLEQLADLLSHEYPDRDLDAVFDQMLSDSIEKHGKRRGTVKPSRVQKPAPPRPPTPGKRARITAAVRREVMERDGYRCTFVSEDGRRCECTTRLELDHLDPAKATGASRPEDLTVRCKPHNQLRSIRLYGRRYVERRIAEARKERRERRAGKPIAASGSGIGEPPSWAGTEDAGRPR